MTEDLSGALVTYQQDGAVAVVRFNRPHRLNAVTAELYGQLLEHLEAAAGDPGVRTVLLAGHGRAFCVGADLREHAEAERGRAEREAYVWAGQAACRALQRMPKPVVAAVHGYAFGAGAELALSADLLVIAEDAVMGFPEVSIGTYVGGGLTYRLPRLVGHARAAELLLLGRRFTGSDAAAWGLAAAAVPADELTVRARELAGELAAKAPVSLAHAKQDLNDPPPTPPDAYAREAEHLLHCMTTEDWREGARAFAEKRAPRFSGR